ncbi:polysaccharide biosynthesis/export family protein [Novosphingobium tardum]
MLTAIGFSEELDSMPMLVRLPLWRHLSLALALPLALSACGKPNFDPAAASRVAVTETLPEPGAEDLYGTAREARIGPGDKINIVVLGISDLERTVVVDGNGRIVFPLIGTVDALGLTPAELAASIQTRLSQRYLQNPQVSVAITEPVSQRFTIYGGVTRPGIYPAVGNETLTDAIAQASGTSDTARLDEVVVFRTVQGKRMAARFDLRAISGGRADDPAVYPNDRIVVGSDSNRTLLRDLAPLTPVLGLFYQIL